MDCLKHGHLISPANLCSSRVARTAGRKLSGMAGEMAPNSKSKALQRQQWSDIFNKFHVDCLLYLQFGIKLQGAYKRQIYREYGMHVYDVYGNFHICSSHHLSSDMLNDSFLLHFVHFSCQLCLMNYVLFLLKMLFNS